VSTKELTSGRVSTEHRNGDLALAEQVVLSGAGLASQGIDIGRVNALAALNVVDEVVLGSLGVVEEWNRFTGQLAEQFGNRPVEVARKAYTAGAQTVRQFLSSI
jgi:hypothetical protein